MPDELSQEELNALLNEAAQAIPPGPPAPAAPAGMQFVAAPQATVAPVILPPGPSPEFLRRQAAMAPVPSGYGVASGPAGTFGVVNPPAAPGADVAAFMEQMRVQLNATKFKEQSAAQDVATRFQATRAYQNFLAGGGDPVRGLQMYGALMLGKQTASLPGLINATRAVPPPAITNIGGVNVLRSGLRGERAVALPPPVGTGPVQTEPLLGTDDKPIPGVRAARGKGGSLHVVKETPEEAKPTPAFELNLLKAKIAIAETAMKAYGTDTQEWKDAEKDFKDLTGQLKRFGNKPSAQTNAPAKRFRYNPQTKTLEEQ